LALFKLKCDCGKDKSVFGCMFSSLSEKQLMCPCGKTMYRNVTPPSTQIMERLDNGFMVKAVERYSDAAELFKKRHDEADPIAGTRPNRS